MQTARHLNIHRSKKISLRISFSVGNRIHHLVVKREQIEFRDESRFHKYKCLIGFPLLQLLDDQEIVVNHGTDLRDSIPFPYCSDQLWISDGKNRYSCFIDTGSPSDIDAIVNPALDLSKLERELYLIYRGEKILQIFSLGRVQQLNQKTKYDFILTRSILQQLAQLGYQCRA